MSGRGAKNEKGSRYLTQLDQALCNGNWSEIQELARKTDKHAPGRSCLTAAARTEAQTASTKYRPVSAGTSSTVSAQSLDELASKLKRDTASNQEASDDVYAAQVCLAQICWLQGHHDAALSALEVAAELSEADGSDVPALGWLEVCQVKAKLIKAASLEAVGRDGAAEQVYLNAVAKIPGSRTAELRQWTERLLAAACTFMHKRNTSPTVRSLSQSLSCFNTWSDFSQRSGPSSGTSTGAVDVVSRRQVWGAYYDLLSTILQYGLLYKSSSTMDAGVLLVPSRLMPQEENILAKNHQWADMRRVQARYESLLLDQTKFPKASETNIEIEEWVSKVVANWKIVCGTQWSNNELGAGGKAGVSHNVLDILYRAATKTFHSTPILRQLFTVHAALGEYDLAINAFNSYVELVSKAKARAEKTGKHELDSDSDDAAILTAAEAIRLLCRYGDHDQGEKVVEVGKTIQQWLGDQRPESIDRAQSASNDNPTAHPQPSAQSTHSQLRPATLAAAYRALGISNAHCARLNYDTTAQAELRTAALAYLQLALTYDGGDVETAYALALAQAESGNADASIQTVKRAVASGKFADVDEILGPKLLRSKVQLVSLWHLLAMCLTAKDEFEQGAAVCEVALEHSVDGPVLPADNNNNNNSSSRDTPSEKPIASLRKFDHSQLEDTDKENAISVEMSRLTLVQLIEGPEAAIDRSHELLAMYARLFGTPEPDQATLRPPQSAVSATPSKKSTLRSIAGSIRPKSKRRDLEKDSIRQSTASLSATRRPPTAPPTTNGQGAPIAITVTNEDGVSSQESQPHHKPFPLHLRSRDDRPHPDGRLGSIKNADDIPKKTVNGHATSSTLAASDGQDRNDKTALTEKVDPNENLSSEESSRAMSMGPQQPIEEVYHNEKHDTWPAPAGHDDYPPAQDVRLPAPHPSTDQTYDARFSLLQDRQRKSSLLIKVWLFIAGLYLGADLLDDAVGAVDEAIKTVKSFEIEVGNEESSARRFHEKRWGGGKSVDELWADIWSVRGSIATARNLPFEAMKHYEEALTRYDDHADGIIGLSNLLMDIYEEIIPTSEPRPHLQSHTASSMPQPFMPRALENLNDAVPDEEPTKDLYGDPTPIQINRLASRDRAYMLLSTLTRLGTGWNNPEAWLALARAYELSGQVKKAKEALWWVVELEENRPVRPWSEVGAGGYTL